MSSWKRLSNLGKATLKQSLGSVARADQDSQDINALRDLERELTAEAAGGAPVSDDLVARAREVRERLEAARSDAGLGISGGEGGGGGKDGDKYEPPGPPERLPDGTVKRSL